MSRRLQRRLYKELVAGNYGCAFRQLANLPLLCVLSGCCPAAGACAALYLCRPPASTSIQHTSNPPLTFRSPPLSYVKLAVATYDTLLLSSRPEKSNLLANELVVRTVVKRRT